MSGRSAYVRKKITETQLREKGIAEAARARSKSFASPEDNVPSVGDYGPVPGHFGPRQDTGVPTMNARFLKFAEQPQQAPEATAHYLQTSYGPQTGSGSQSGSSVDGRRDAVAMTPHFPLEDFAYARARRPVIKTEDVSGIEKSGLRNMLDRKSDDVRKGIAKTFAFRKKDKKNEVMEQAPVPDFRPPSAATVRPSHPGPGSGAAGAFGADFDPGREAFNIPENLAVQYSYPHMATEQPWDSSGMMPPPPTTNLPSIPTAPSAPPIKRWIGAGRPVQRWNKLRKDPELWDPNGDVLVFFGHKGQIPRPNPSFRLSSHIIEATESRYLITLLREGSTEEDIHMPPSPRGAPPMLHRQGGQYGHHHHHLSPHNNGSGYARGGQPTPPISDDASLAEADGQISYEMYFPTPANANKIEQLRHHITTRNVFALLYHASLVGLSLYQALFDLHSRLEAYMPPDADNVGTILNYLSARGIDDVRNDPETAVSLLAWSEGAEVRWEEGWRESFLHCAGMYARLEDCADFKHVTPITRALLERACLETQLRVQAAEERLADFDFGDMWPASVATTASMSGPVTSSPAKGAADRLQQFLVQHYSQVFGQWPPPPPSPRQQDSGVDGEEDMWLTRTVAQSLQRDFAALYDYLVNRDIIWDESEARSSRKWVMASESGNHGFEADTPDLPMTDMLIEFDNKHRFPHIPHPYALVPESIPPLKGSVPGKDTSSGGGWRPKKTNNATNGTGNAGASNGRAGAMERRIQLAYTEATNICLLGSEFTHSDLIDAFSKFEKTDKPGEVDPSVARRGRWVLLYGILQTLASVSVDAPNVRYRDEVPYHLNPRLKGAKMPPWRAFGQHNSKTAGRGEAAHELSHCWTVPQTWNLGTTGSGAGSAPDSGEENSADETSPITRSYSFPRPPGSTAGRSSMAGSMAGYHTPAGTGARSVVSSTASIHPPFSSAGSVISENDTASSFMMPASHSSFRGVGNRRQRRDGGGMSVPRSIETVDEHEQDREWTGRGNRSRAPSTAASSNTSASGLGSYQQYQLAPIKVTGNLRQPEDFFMGDDVVDEPNNFGSATTASAHGREKKRNTGNGSGSDCEGRHSLRDGQEWKPVREKAGRRNGPSSMAGTCAPPRSTGRGAGNGSETESVAPVIRDFDDLDTIDYHHHVV